MVERPRSSRPSPASRGQKPDVLRIRLLGGFQVSVGPRAIEERAWPLKKARSLVKILALAQGHRLHPDVRYARLRNGTP